MIDLLAQASPVVWLLVALFGALLLMAVAMPLAGFLVHHPLFLVWAPGLAIAGWWVASHPVLSAGVAAVVVLALVAGLTRLRHTPRPPQQTLADEAVLR